MIKFRCPLCLLKLKTADDFSDDHLTCPGCHNELEVPSPHYDFGDMIDKYKLDLLLGQGNAGEVYLATDSIMNKTVALKLLIDFGQIDDETQQRFVREAQTLSALEHPNIIKAINAGRYEQGFFIAMSYIDGHTVERLMEQADGLLEESLMLDVCNRVADAMEYAWNEGYFVHRDIKPANIMICRYTKNIYLTDLGLAKSTSNSINITDPQFTLGSPFYMSPEQITETNIDFRSDIYSLGATLYHMACGTPPYSERRPDQIVILKSHQEPKDIRLINPNISQKLENLVKFMMHSDLRQRPQSWKDLKNYLNETIAIPQPK